VNLGYVLNVIEDPVERLRHFGTPGNSLDGFLIVSALVRVPGRGNAFTEFGDGVLTSRGTFQKFFDQPNSENTSKPSSGEKQFRRRWVSFTSSRTRSASSSFWRTVFGVARHRHGLGCQ